MKNVIINTDNYYFDRLKAPGILKFDQLGTATSNRFASNLKRAVIGFNTVLLLFLFLTLTGGAAKAATFTVNLTTDAADAVPGDGICDAVTAVPGSQCTLRAAIEESNILPGVDDITFALDGANAINLTINQLWIKSSLNINGPGARLLTVQRASNAARFRILLIQGSTTKVNISGITIANGNTILENGSNVLGNGGAIFNHGASLTLSEVTVKNNTAPAGGGIFNEGGSLNVARSTFSNNIARQGGGINNRNDAFPVNIINSTISDNTVNDGGVGTPPLGGGIYNNGVMVIVNSTISHNTSNQEGGGIYTDGASLNLKTRNSIIAGNTAPVDSDIYGGATSQGNNLVGIVGSGNGFTNGINGDKVGTSAAPLNALLGALQDNGGQTDTRALLAGSPALDAGNGCVLEVPLCLTPGLTTDQRGLPRKSGAAADIGAFEAQNGAVHKTRGDFDGDQRADIAVFRSLSGTWYVSRSTNNQMQAVHFGMNGDKPVSGDYDGDNKTDIAVFRPSNGVWYILNSSNGQFRAVQFGSNGDTPAPADFDGDGKTDIGVFRPTNGTWYVLRSSNNQMQAAQFGTNGDIAQGADFDKDGKADYVVFRPSNGSWYVLRSSNNQMQAAQFGMSGDIPQIGDYDGDAAADYAVFRPSNGSWYVLLSSNGQLQSAQFGANGDVPSARDYNGDGKADYSVFRPANGGWYIAKPIGNPAQNFDSYFFGQTGDAPAN